MVQTEDDPMFCALIELSRKWEGYNYDYLDSAMHTPGFKSIDARGVFGRWDGRTRTIEIARWHILESPWLEVLATLRHEMAHQYVDEVLQIHDEREHGEAFQLACRRLRVDPAASAEPTIDAGEARIATRIEKLLALGGSPNENEASAAMRKARELMLEHNVGRVGGARRPDYVVKQVGAVRRRQDGWRSSLGAILAEFFFVQTIWTDSYDAMTLTEGSALHVYGTPHTVAMAEYVFGYVSWVVEDLWQRWSRAQKGPVGRLRSQYCLAVVRGFRKSLLEQDREISARNQALVWRGDSELESYFRWHNPRITTRRTSPLYHSEAVRAGYEAGQKVTIQKPLNGGSSDGVSGLLS